MIGKIDFNLIQDFKNHSKWMTITGIYNQIYDYIDKHLIKINLGSLMLVTYSVPQQLAAKLTIFSQHFWPENFRINDVASKLRSLKIKVNIFTGKPNYPKGNIYKGYKKFSFEKRKKNKIRIYRSQIISRGNSSSIRLILNYLSYVFFSLLKEYFEQLKPISGENFKTLSMGMSGDYLEAISNGSNMIRIGSDIFGKR